MCLCAGQAIECVQEMWFPGTFVDAGGGVIDCEEVLPAELSILGEYFAGHKQVVV